MSRVGAWLEVMVPLSGPPNSWALGKADRQDGRLVVVDGDGVLARRVPRRCSDNDHCLGPVQQRIVDDGDRQCRGCLPGEDRDGGRHRHSVGIAGRERYHQIGAQSCRNAKRSVDDAVSLVEVGCECGHDRRQTGNLEVIAVAGMPRAVIRVQVDVGPCLLDDNIAGPKPVDKRCGRGSDGHWGSPGDRETRIERSEAWGAVIDPIGGRIMIGGSDTLIGIAGCAGHSGDGGSLPVCRNDRYGIGDRGGVDCRGPHEVLHIAVVVQKQDTGCGAFRPVEVSAAVEMGIRTGARARFLQEKDAAGRNHRSSWNNQCLQRRG